ncbi:MAG: acyltransferase [Xanthobacteraceae bacterium]
MESAGSKPQTQGAGGARIPALDGVRGLMMILVLVSHYFGEIKQGYAAAEFGWLAVQMFFILSGFLIGRLIMERKEHANFFSVFVMRRLCRTIPSYMVSILLIFGVAWIFRRESWTHFSTDFPLWSYLTFTQNVFMGMTGEVGQYWAAPSWTLALEEQLYVLLPLVFFLAPQRLWLRIFIAVALLAVLLRAVIFVTGVVGPTWALVMLPTRGDTLVAGVIAAILYKRSDLDLARFDLLLRAAPIVLMVLTILLVLIDPVERRVFNILGPFFISAGFAALLLAIVRGAPEAKRFEGRFLGFFGDISYCVYLTHLMVLGVLHGVILHAKPELGTIEQWFITLAAVPVAVGLGWAMTVVIEAPLTTYGRSWKWGEKLTAYDPLRKRGVAA